MSDLFEDMRNAQNKYYGLKPLSFKEEFNLPKYARQTRHNKMKIIDTCDHATKLIDTIKYRAKYAPELNDPEHAELVQEFADKVNELYKAVEAAARVGQR